jgi:hypothetical protein
MKDAATSGGRLGSPLQMETPRPRPAGGPSRPPMMTGGHSKFLLSALPPDEGRRRMGRPASQRLVGERELQRPRAVVGAGK